MRTTVELTDVQRAKLLALAARRGEKGFSRLVQEAVDLYLASEDQRQQDTRTRAAIGVLGSLDHESADSLLDAANRLRRDWR